MTKLYLTRHGETEWNEKGMMQGWQDSPLTELGENQAIWLMERMKNLHIDVIYSSPIGRAFYTAKIIKGDKNIPLITDDGLKEMNFGLWEGQNYEILKAADKDNHFNFWNVPSKYVPTGDGETFNEIKQRSFNTINKILEKEKGKTILIVTHTITLKSFLNALDKKDIDDLWDPPFIKQTSLTEINFTEDGYEMPLVACTEHHKLSRKEYDDE